MDIVDFLLLCVGFAAFVIAFIVARMVGEPWKNVIILAFCAGLLAHQAIAYGMVAYVALIRRKQRKDGKSGVSESEDERGL